MSIKLLKKMFGIRGASTMSKSAHIKYLSYVDGLRAIAVLSIVIFNAFPEYVKGGYVGIDIFFVISGFLISSIIFDSLDHKKFSFIDFYVRRIKRIFPALIVVLVSCLIIGRFVLFTEEYKQLGKYIISGATFTSNFILRNEGGYFDAASELKPLLHLWPLAIEAQFYLIWPVLVFLVWKRGFNVFSLMVSIVLASLIFNITKVHGNDAAAAFYLPASRFWELMIGGLLAYIWLYKKALFEKNSKRIDSFVGFIIYRDARSFDVRSFLGILLIAMAIFLGRVSSSLIVWHLLASIGAFFLISAGPDAWLNRKIIAHRVLVFIGLISYPLYLWHWPLLSFAKIVSYGSLTNSYYIAGVKIAIIIFSIILSWLTYILIEKPIKTLGKRVAVFLLIILICIGLMGFYVSKKDIAPQNKIDVASNDWDFPGANWHTFTFEDKVLGWHQGTNVKEVLFLGDSNMEQYAPRIEELMKEDPTHTRSAIFATKGGCAPIPNVGRPDLKQCFNSVQDAREFARKDKNVDSVVVSALWNDRFSYDGHYYSFYKDGDKELKLTSPEGGEKAYEALESMLSEFKRLGKKTYLILNIPMGEQFEPADIIRRGLLNTSFKTNKTSVDEETLFTNKLYPAARQVRQRLKEVASRSGAIAIDPLDYLCHEKSCSVFTPDGELIYKNAGHLRSSFCRKDIHYVDEIMKIKE